jgi:hypothetical protein
MKFLKREKTRGNVNLTHEVLMWLLVLAIMIAPLLYVFRVFVR